MMSQLTKKEIVESVPQKGFFGHPKGLFTLFFTEFWERFSYYGMRAILVFYMYYEVTNGGLGLDKTLALSIMSIYGSLVYMSGIIGGWLADRIFGTSKAIFYGGIFHHAWSYRACDSRQYHNVFHFDGTHRIGTGLLKPNVSSVVGDIYPENDQQTRRRIQYFLYGH